MTYLQFLVVFMLPPLALIGLRPYGSGRASRRAAITTAALAALACVWTLPWDSWIIGRGVWGYPPGRVSATVWQVPVEEIGFMAAQTVLVALWSRQLTGVDRPLPAVSGRPRAGAALACAGAAAVAAVALRVGGSHALYLGSMVSWFAPPLALQYAAGADILAAHRRLRLTALLPCWLYLCVADRIAIGDGVWHLSHRYTAGVSAVGLPLEEIVFFGITCLLVVNTVVLVDSPRLRPASAATVVHGGTVHDDPQREASGG